MHSYTMLTAGRRSKVLVLGGVLVLAPSTLRKGPELVVLVMWLGSKHHALALLSTNVFLSQGTFFL